MKTAALVIVTVMLVAVTVYAFSGRRPLLMAPAVRDRDDSRVELQRELDELKAEVAELKSAGKRPLTFVVAPQPSAVEAAPAPAATPEDSAAIAEEERRYHDELAEKLDARLTSQATDSDWSRTTTQEIATAIADSAPGTRLASTRCATTLCRVSVTHDSPDIQKNVGNAIAEVGPFRHGAIYHYEEGSPPRTTIYVLREGHNLRDQLE